MQSRLSLLEELFHYEDPNQLRTVWEKLSAYSWDSDEKGVLTSEHIISVLTRYLAGQLTEQQVENWAELAEARDDISYGESEYDPEIMDAIYRLGNPACEGVLTADIAHSLIESLKSKR